MQKWEYKVVKRVDVSESGLNELGAEGWDLIQSGTGGYMFRRALR